MGRRARERDLRWQRLAAVYAATFLLGSAGLAVALSVGSGIDAAPQLAPVSAVEGDAVDCLGTEVVTIQSGVHLELHRPSDSGANGLVGDRVLRGRVQRSSGSATMTGHCLDGSTLAGLPVTANMTVRRGAASGTIEIDGERLELTLRPVTSVLEQNTGTKAPLQGGTLVARTFLAVAVILVAARLVGVMFRRVRLTRVMGEIVAGIVLGPSLLGAVWPAANQYLFPATVTALLDIVGQFGLVFFMFLVGLELNRRLVRGIGHRVVLMSHVSIIVPFTIGAALAVALYPQLGSGGFVGFALFMGAAMAITAFPVLARILKDTGLDRTRLGALALTCAAVDDLTAWCILAAVVAVVNASGATDVVRTLVLTAGFVGLMGFVVRPLLLRGATALRRRGELDQALVPSVLVCLLLSAWATEMIGIHSIFGAFLLGVVMPRPPWVRRAIQTRLEDVTVVFLLPVFFAVVGLSIRVSLLDEAELWLFTGAIIAAACVGKLGGSMFAARILGYPWRQSTAIGLLMNTRGLTEIVILTVGQRLGVVSPALFVMLVLMALVTTLMATPLLSVVYPEPLIRAEAAAHAAERALVNGSPNGEAPAPTPDGGHLPPQSSPGDLADQLTGNGRT
ncbi:MAG: cation:proton antiporter [Acidimicrobiales bacterium]